MALESILEVENIADLDPESLSRQFEELFEY